MSDGENAVKKNVAAVRMGLSELILQVGHKVTERASAAGL